MNNSPSSQVLLTSATNLNIQPTTTAAPSTPQSRNPLKLLVNKTVFLDVNSSYKLLSRLKECLLSIGVTLADCMSKDINYLITNRGKLEDLKLESSPQTPTTAHPKTSPTLNFSRHSAINRTQQILGNASKGMASDIVSVARRLGIQVLHIAELEMHVNKYWSRLKSQNNAGNGSQSGSKKAAEDRRSIENELIVDAGKDSKLRRLKTPFFKMESICKQYKPLFQEFKQWHDLLLEPNTKGTTQSPFQIYFSDENKHVKSASNNDHESDKATNNDSHQPTPIKKQPLNSIKRTSPLLNATPKSTHTPFFQRHNSLIAGTATPKALIKPPSPPKKKQGGYCECCKARYDNLRHHLVSLQHENFERNASNFREIDQFVSESLNFDEFFKRKTAHLIPTEPENEPQESSSSCDENANTNITEPRSDFQIEIVDSDDPENTLIMLNDDADEHFEEEKPMGDFEDKGKIIEEKNVEEVVEKVCEGEEIVERVENVVESIEMRIGQRERILEETQNVVVEPERVSEEPKKKKSRSKAAASYTEMTNRDFNLVFAPDAVDETEKKSKKKSKKKDADKNGGENETGEKTKRRKRKAPEAIEQEKKPKIKLKLEKNKSGNTNEWHVSSSSHMADDMQDIEYARKRMEIDRQFDDALYELANSRLDIDEPSNMSTIKPSPVEVQSSKRAKLQKSPKKKPQPLSIHQNQQIPLHQLHQNLTPNSFMHHNVNFNYANHHHHHHQQQSNFNYFNNNMSFYFAQQQQQHQQQQLPHSLYQNPHQVYSSYQLHQQSNMQHHQANMVPQQSSSSFMRHNSMPTYFNTHSQCSNDSYNFSSTNYDASSNASNAAATTTTKRASLNESLSLFDTLSAANSLINNFN